MTDTWNAAYYNGMKYFWTWGSRGSPKKVHTGSVLTWAHPSSQIYQSNC